MAGHLPGFLPLSGEVSHLERPWRLNDAAVDSVDAPRPILHRFLATRGFVEQSDIDDYLSFSLANMADPALMPDATVAADRILDAIKRDEKVTVYGDYDVDGVTSSALLFLALRAMFGFEVEVYIPHRLKEGYGLMRKQSVKLLRVGLHLSLP